MSIKLVEENLNLAKAAAIYWSKRTVLDCDDCYQIASIGLLKASKTFKEGMGAKFQTWAHTHINNEILNELRKAKRRSNEVLLFNTIDGEENTTIEDFGYEDTNFGLVEDRVVYGDIANIIKSELTEREWDIACKIADGVEQHKIAEIYGFQQPHVSRIMKGIRKKVEKWQVYCMSMASL